MQAAAYLRKCRSTRGRPLGRIRPDQLSCLFPPPPCVSPVLQLRLTVSGSAACPTPIMERWEQLSGARCGCVAWGREQYASFTELGQHACSCLQSFIGPLKGLLGWHSWHATPCHLPHVTRRSYPFVCAGEKLLERYGMTETGMLLGNPYRCVICPLGCMIGTGMHARAALGHVQ